MNIDNNSNITLEQATKLAEEDLHCNGDRVIVQIRETDNLWIFTAGKPNIVQCGGRNMIAIKKATGEIYTFILPDKRNFEILRSSKVIYKISD